MADEGTRKELGELKELLDSDCITREQFEVQRDALLAIATYYKVRRTQPEVTCVNVCVVVLGRADEENT